MTYNLHQAIEILERTPQVIRTLLDGISSEWITNNEGPDTWSPYQVVGHLIYGEKTDWIPRSRIILSDSSDKTFEPFDRFAQEKEDQNRSINELLTEFADLRKENIAALKAFNITNEDLDKKGIHPELGECTLGSLLSTWVVHDLGHIAQISRVMAKQYKDEVGVWSQYLGILKK